MFREVAIWATLPLISKPLAITGLVFRRSLYGEVLPWHCEDVNELRELRRNANATQRDLAELLKIPVNTFRMWDSGLRRPPVHIVTQVAGPSPRGPNNDNFCRWRNSPRNSACTSEHCRPRRARDAWRPNSVCGRYSDGRFAPPPVTPGSGSSLCTTVASVGRRYARLRCRSCLMTMTSGYETCAVGGA